MKFPSRFLIVSLLFLLSLFPLQVSESCGYIAPDFIGYSIIHPHISEARTEKPLIFTYNYVNQGDMFITEWPDDRPDKNLVEWQQYFCGKPTIKDLNYIIYKSEIYELEQIRKLQEDKNISIPDTLSGNTFIQTYSQFKFPHFLDYLIFAKKVEMELAPWQLPWKQKDIVPEVIQDLKNYAIDKHENIDDDFLRLRYAYHILRLDRGFGNLETSYEKYVKPLADVESVIQNRCLEHLGGWLSQSPNPEEAAIGNVLLGKSLIGNLDRSLSVYLSFRIGKQTDWDLAMSKCTSNQERSMLHYIRALEKHSVALEDMKSIYELDPNSSVLEVLMIREIQKIELQLLEKKVKNKKPWKYFPKEEYGLPENYAFKYLEKIKPFVKKVSAEKKGHRPAFWMMMDGYLEYLSRNNRLAQQLLNEAKDNALPNSNLKHQIELFELVTLFSLMNTMNEEVEKKAGQVIKTNPLFLRQSYDESDFFMAKMASLYQLKGDYTKSYLCNYSIYGLKFYPDSKIAKGVVDLFDKKEKNELEEFLLQDDSIKTRDGLLDLWGTALLGENRHQEAFEVFQQIPSFGTKIKYPFLTNIYELEISKRYPQEKDFTKYEISKKILERETQSQGGALAGQAHLQLGNYHYNSSYFGFAWKAKDYFKSINGMISDISFYRNWLPACGAKGNKEFIDLSKSKAHFYQVFENTSDKELRAQATFMLWRIEMQTNFINKIKDKDRIYTKKYRKQFQDSFQDTQFFTEVIKECEWFEKY